MVAAPLLTSGVAVDLPQAKAGALNVEQKPIAIALNDQGQVFLMDQPIADADLLDKLQDARQGRSPTQRIYVRASKVVPYGRVAADHGRGDRGRLQEGRARHRAGHSHEARPGVSDQPSKAGLYVSGALHAALLAFIVIGFSPAPKFDDATESIPVDTVTQSQFNEIMKGERDAKPVKEPPAEPHDSARPRSNRRRRRRRPEPPPELKTADEPPPPPPPPPSPRRRLRPSPRRRRPRRRRSRPPRTRRRLRSGPRRRRRRTSRSPTRSPRSLGEGQARRTGQAARSTYDPNAIAKLIGQTKS